MKKRGFKLLFLSYKVAPHPTFLPLSIKERSTISLEAVESRRIRSRVGLPIKMLFDFQ